MKDEKKLSLIEKSAREWLLEFRNWMCSGKTYNWSYTLSIDGLYLIINRW